MRVTPTRNRQKIRIKYITNLDSLGAILFAADRRYGAHMGTTNFEKFKQKMEQAKAKKSVTSSQFNWMKLDAGKRYTLRFLPLKSENLELPIAIYHHHALKFPDGHFESIACPKKSEDRDCPFCAQASQLYRKFTKTENVEYKEAAKKLFVKTHYLLVGFEPDQIDATEIKPEDLKIVRASSKANMELLEAKLAKEIDFVDFTTGRTIDLIKTKGTGKDAITNITWDFNDPGVAIEGKNGRKTFDELVDKSPDLTPIVKAMDDASLQKKYEEFMAAPVSSDTEDDHDEVERAAFIAPTPKPKASPKAAPKEDDSLPFDIEDMKNALEED